MLGICKNVPVSEKAREKQERGQGGETAASLSGQAAANIRHIISRTGRWPHNLCMISAGEEGDSCRSEQTGSRVTCA
jgi:hypothetical protein